MTRRLSTDGLASIRSATRPGYERQKVGCGIVHLGIGGFHRAHQAVYTDDLLASGDLSWGITGVSLRSSAVRDALAAQDFLYSVKTLGPDARPPRIVGSVIDTLAIREREQKNRALELLANPATQVVSLTVTEKGYCATHTGDLDETNPDVIHDLANPHTPRSVPGFLAAGLEQRMASGAGPLTILSCDNLSNNGRVTLCVTHAMANQRNKALGTWLTDHVSFPSSMVDRIVPQTNESDITSFEREVGYLDKAVICGEPFSQWVIEDDFRGKRPGWDIGGAQFTTNVAPFEQAKLRLLNATHSALAYLGLLWGYTYVHEAIQNQQLRACVVGMLDQEISPEVVCPEGMDIKVYTASVLDRFANSAVPYPTAQVAGDGSLKLPQRIFPTIKTRLAAGKSAHRLILVVASWIECLAGNASTRHRFVVSDPAAATVVALAKKNPNPNDLLTAIARETSYLGDLATDTKFLKQLIYALEKLRTDGVAAAVT